MLLLHTILFLGSALNLCKSKKVSVENSLIYGPGLNANVVLPARYFYIQAVDTKGKNYTNSPGKDAFKVEFTTTKGSRIRVWCEVLDRNDGSFIARFRFYESLAEILIEVKHNGKHVAKSPYHMKDISYHEQCYCPEHDETKWLNHMSCPASYDQINNDLKPFPKVDINTVAKKAIAAFGKHHALCHYSVIDNQVYRKCYGEHVGFAMFMDAWLLSLARKIRLPDIEFFSNLGDWPLSKRNKDQDPIPIFSWCGSDDTNDIVMPTYDLTESVLETLGRVTLDMLSVQGNTGPKWKKKIPKGFFRGRDSRQERLDLTILGRSKPDLFDVGLTNFFFFDYDEKKYGPKNSHISFFDFFKYKYQLNVDGTVAAYRFPYLLAGDSVVFKQDSNYYEHFYHELQPMKHYIPFRRDLSDIEKQLKWAKSHDKEARNIALNGQLYARNNLMGDRLYCYSYRLFKEFSTRLTRKPKLREGMEHILQPSDHDSKCECRHRKPATPKTPSTSKAITKTKSTKTPQKEKQVHEEL